jgi:hypothetical protein
MGWASQLAIYHVSYDSKLRTKLMAHSVAAKCLLQ